MKSVFRFLSSIGLSIAIVATPAFANQYDTVKNATNNEGGYFSAPNVSMSSNWSSSFPCRFLIKTHWLAYNGAYASYKDWIEVGRVHGEVEDNTGTYTCSGKKVKFYDAYYTGYGIWDASGNLTITEWPVTGFSTTGTHNYQIQRTGSAQWKAYIDFTTVRTFSWNQVNAVRHDIGWETNTSASTWSTPNYSSAHELLISGTWQRWTTGYKSDASNGGNSLGWYVKFGTNANGTTDHSKAEYYR